MATKKTTGNFVTVACRLPQGLNIKVPNGPAIVLHGSLGPYAVAGHGLTEVESSAWDAVVAHFSELPGAKWLHNAAVFVSAKRDSAVDQAKDKAEVNVGFNPIDPANPGVRGIEQG